MDNFEIQSQGYKTIAHISDLHIGRWSRGYKSTVLLQKALKKIEADLIVVTGDITENGRLAEYRIFNEIFSDFLDQGRVLIVPGNHDRLGHEVANKIMDGRDMEVFHTDGLYLVKVDTTGEHNRRLFSGHGNFDQSMLTHLLKLISEAGSNDLVIVIFHHHPLPLAEDLISEKIASFLGWPYASELSIGTELIERLRGKCDLVLHGHRHQYSENIFVEGSRPLRIYNAGASNLHRRFRLFKYASGKLLESPDWIDVASLDL
ncbi:MAG: metallophosphoesterase [Patescibacteria group bacterium]